MLDNIHRNHISEISSIEHLCRHQEGLKDCVIQGLDLRDVDIDWAQIGLENVTFLGCTFAHMEDELTVRRRGADVFPRFEHLPYKPYRSQLYRWQELMEGYDPDNDQSVDLQIYQHFTNKRHGLDIREALAQRIHDHAIDNALGNLFVFNEEGMSDRKGVGFMGGHGVLRTDPFFKKVVRTAQLLTKRGYFIVSGGGPGIMEAANLGGYMAAYTEEELENVFEILDRAPYYRDAGYIERAKEVLDTYPDGSESLAVPTWFYGHEPSNLFASHIAKYFSNSIREDCLLAVSLYGVVFAPGSAGTTQEIFMDATQNHYGTFGYYSPMVFLGRERYLKETLIYPLLRQLAWGRAYEEMLFITDTPQEVVDFIEGHPPIRVKGL